MLKNLITAAILLCSFFSSYGQSDVFISQYIETSSGVTPKGIEVSNVSGIDIDFSVNNLEVYQGSNGGTCSSIVTISSGILKASEVWVIGTSELTTYATNNGISLSGVTTFNFAFNGDDALQLYLGGVLQDVFGSCGVDPGSSWLGGGVSTANNNLQIKTSICDGTLINWSDPSLRFDQIFDGITMTGFGDVPLSCSVPTPTIIVNPTSLTGLDYPESLGPSAEQSFTVEGTNLTNDITLTAPTNFEISTTPGVGFGPNITLTQAGGIVSTTTIYVRLSAALAVNTYGGNIAATSTGATTQNVAVSGEVIQPVITVTPTSLTGLDYVFGIGPSAEQTFVASGTNLSDNITLTSPLNFEISTTSGSGFGSTVTLIPSANTVTSTTIYVRLAAGLAVNTYGASNITANSNFASVKNVAVNGEVTAPAATCSELFIGPRIGSKTLHF